MNTFIINDAEDIKRRRFITMTSSAIGTVGVVVATVPFISSMLPSERAKAAGSPVELDVQKLEPGQMIRVEWRGKPVFILNRTPEMNQGLDFVNDYIEPTQKL